MTVDGRLVQLTAGLLLVGLPMSMVGWTWLTVSAGRLLDASQQPASFRFIAARAKDWVPQHPPNLTEMTVALLLLGFVNAYPLLVLLLWPYGVVGRLIPLGYFCIQGILLRRIWRAIRTSRRQAG